MNSSNMWNIFNKLSKSFDDDYCDKIDTLKEKTNYDKNICEVCGEVGTVLADNGMMVCSKCGIQNEIEIDVGQEWRYYCDNDNKSGSDPTRVGLPTNTLIPNSMLSTIILGYGGESFRRHQKWGTASHKDRSIYEIYNKLKIICLSNGLTQCVIDKAIAMYLKYDKLKRGDTRMGILAACILYACRDKTISRTIEEIEDIFDISRKKLSSGFKDLHNGLYNYNPSYISEIEPFLPEYDIVRYCNLLKIGKKHIDAAKEVYYMADFFGLVSNITPKSITLGCIYFVICYYKLDINIKKLVKIASSKRRKGILDSAIYNTCSILDPYKYFLIPLEDW